MPCRRTSRRNSGWTARLASGMGGAESDLNSKEHGLGIGIFSTNNNYVRHTLLSPTDKAMFHTHSDVSSGMMIGFLDATATDGEPIPDLRPAIGTLALPSAPPPGSASSGRAAPSPGGVNDDLIPAAGFGPAPEGNCGCIWRLIRWEGGGSRNLLRTFCKSGIRDSGPSEAPPSDSSSSAACPRQGKDSGFEIPSCTHDINDMMRIGEDEGFWIAFKPTAISTPVVPCTATAADPSCSPRTAVAILAVLLSSGLGWVAALVLGWGKGGASWREAAASEM